MSEEFGILLGKFAVARQLLSQEQARYCFQMSHSHGRSFTDTALSLGYLSQDQIQFLIGQIQQQQTMLDRPTTPNPVPSFQLQTTVLSPPSALLDGSESDARTVRLPPGSSSIPPPRPASSTSPQSSKRSGLNTGEIFDGYEVLSLLGQGGMGAVYKVEKQGKIFALKVITTENMKAEARFEREAGAAMSVSGHPNIVAIEGYTKFDDMPYLVMEFVEGKGLDEFIVPGEPYDPDKIVELATKIASALAFVHKKGITHRDLKPANILIRESDGEPLITDFGLAKLVDYETMTRTADWLGTPAYMSPEQAGMDHKEVDSTSDTWALGVILYELSTGRRPFQADEIYQLINMILEKNPEPPSSYNSNIDPNLETIILKTLNKEKKNRYSDANELARDISKIGGGESVEAYIEGSFVEMKRGIKKNVGHRSLNLTWIALLLVVPAIASFAFFKLADIDENGEFADVRIGITNYKSAIEEIDEGDVFEQCARGMPEFGLFSEPEDSLGRHQDKVKELRSTLQDALLELGDPKAVLKKTKTTKTLGKLDTQFEFYQSLIYPQRKLSPGVKFSSDENTLIEGLKLYQQRKGEQGARDALKKFKRVRNEKKDKYTLSLALYGKAMCLVRLGDLAQASAAFDELSTKKSLGSLGEEFYIFYKGGEAISKLLKFDEKGGMYTLSQFSQRLQRRNEDKRKELWAAWNKRFKERYLEAKNLQIPKPSRIKQWLLFEKVKKKHEEFVLFSLDFELSKALGEYHARRYSNGGHSGSARRLESQRKAIYYYLNAFLKNKAYKAPDGYHAPQLADFISAQSLPSKSPRERELAFRVLIDASRIGVYIPTFQAALSQFIKRGFFEKAFEEAPNDPYLHFWRGSGAVPYYTSLWNENRLELTELLDIIDRSANDLDIVWSTPDLPSYFRALAADRWVATRRFKEDIAKGQDRSINTDNWRSRLKAAIAMNTHPKPGNLYQSLYHLTDFKDMDLKMGLVHKRLAAIQDRRDRSEKSDLERYRGRPIGCPMDALNQSEFLRLEASNNRLYAECYLKMRQYSKVIEVAKKSYEFERSQGSQDIEETSVSYLLDAYLATNALDEFDQLYSDLKAIEKQYKADGNSKLDWIAKLKKYKVARDKRPK